MWAARKRVDETDRAESLGFEVSVYRRKIVKASAELIYRAAENLSNLSFI
jgi:hypothetical protein